MTQNDVYQEIVNITQTIIENGLSIQEKWPVRSGNKIAWLDQKDISIALKNISYVEKYFAIEKENNYNIKMLDGALIQIMYEFNNTGRELLSHRLAYFPAPHLERYDENPEDYDTLYFGDSEFHDLFEKYIVSSPIRFDYNVATPPFVELSHPYSHIHFGEYEFCRIPICSPITPSIFIHFIIRNFYNFSLQKNGDIIPISTYRFASSITELEKSHLHFSIM